MILLKTLGVVSIDSLPGKVINLDYSRVEVAAKARQWPTKL